MNQADRVHEHQPASWQLLFGLIDQPGATLREIVARPRGRWWLPTLLALLAIIVSAIIFAPYLLEQSQQATQAMLANLSSEQRALAESQLGMMQNPMLLGGMTAVTGLLGLLLGWVIQSALFFFGTTLMGGEANYERVFAAMPWIGLPFTFERLLQSVFTLLKGELIINQGLSYLVSSGKPITDAGSPAYGVLSIVTLFWLWHLVLGYKLLANGLKLGRGSAAMLTLLYAGLTLAARAGLAALNGIFTMNLS